MYYFCEKSIIKGMKLLGIDMGDAWVGTALAGQSGICCSPYKTVPLSSLCSFLLQLSALESVSTIVVGLPLSHKGEESLQALKIRTDFAKVQQEPALKKFFDQVTIVWWDERLSSSRASSLLKGSKKKTDKLREHSIAAAFILQSYLDSKAFGDLHVQEDEE